MNLNQPTAVRASISDFDAKPLLIFTRDTKPDSKPVKATSFGWTGSFSLKLILLIFGFTLGACQKEQVQDTVIEGRIKEVGSFEPVRVEGLRLGLFKKGQLSIFPSRDLKIAEFKTDADGSFYYTTKLDQYHGMYYVALLDEVDGYYIFDRERPLLSPAFNMIQLNLNREAWIELILNNEGGNMYDYFRFLINEARYSHTGAGRPSVIQRVASLDTLEIYLADYRYDPMLQSEYKLIVQPNDTLRFEIDLRPQ